MGEVEAPLLEQSEVVQYLTSGLLRQKDKAQVLCTRFIEELHDGNKGILISDSDGRDYVNFRFSFTLKPQEDHDEHPEILLINNIQTTSGASSLRSVFIPLNESIANQANAVAHQLDGFIAEAMGSNKNWISYNGYPWCFTSGSNGTGDRDVRLDMFALRYLITGAVVVYLQGDRDQVNYQMAKENIVWGAFNKPKGDVLKATAAIIGQVLDDIKFPTRFTDLTDLRILYEHVFRGSPGSPEVVRKLIQSLNLEKPKVPTALFKRFAPVTTGTQDIYQPAMALVLNNMSHMNTLIKDNGEDLLTIHTVDWGGRGDCAYPAILGYDKIVHNLELRRYGLLVKLVRTFEDVPTAVRTWAKLDEPVRAWQTFVDEQQERVAQVQRSKNSAGESLSDLIIEAVNNNVDMAKAVQAVTIVDSYREKQKGGGVHEKWLVQDKRETGTYADDSDFEDIALLLNVTINLYTGVKLTTENEPAYIDVFPNSTYPEDAQEATYVRLDTESGRYLRVVPYTQFAPGDQLYPMYGGPDGTTPIDCVNILSTQSLFLHQGVQHFVPIELYKNGQPVESARRRANFPDRSMSGNDVGVWLFGKFNDYLERQNYQ